ncbi:unnamed protein product [marine sediment metagenome]|uniref:Uncharacterized protein n=1 Tax=marine sediment metagenome TaxID=412755 RepID=X1PY34_9ZZZZ
MSFIPENLRKEMGEKLDKIEIFQRILLDEELEEKKAKFVKFIKENHDNDKIFNDGLADWIYVKSPEENENYKPRPVDSDFSNDNYLFVCKCKLGPISVFGALEQLEEIGWNNGVAIRGKFKKQYKIVGSGEYYKSLKTMCKEYLKDVKDIVKDDDYYESYSINIHQVVE